MNSGPRRISLFVILTILLSTSYAAETNPASERIGIYDSRAIAYAHFWSEPYQKKIQDLAKSGKEARATGDKVRHRDMEATLKNEQEQNHLQVFSTAPVDGILVSMQSRVDEIQCANRVSCLVSKWDQATLKTFEHAEQIEVTDALLRDFRLNEKQMKVIADIRKQKPLPLDKARELLRKGKL